MTVNENVLTAGPLVVWGSDFSAVVDRVSERTAGGYQFRREVTEMGASGIQAGRQNDAQGVARPIWFAWLEPSRPGDPGALI